MLTPQTPPGGRMPVYFLCHGGGPWPYMQGGLREQLRWLEASLKDLPRQLPQPPKAIVVVSSHWEAPGFSVTSSPSPGMVYDFYGFPSEMYRIRYPAPGSPALAQRMVAMLKAAGCPAHPDGTQGFDHSTYSLLQPMYPQAEVPVVQLSMCESLDPATHVRAGEALAPLRDEGVLIIGSGMSCHERGAHMALPSARFDHWLRRHLLEASPAERREALLHWTEAPYARTVHPREDHLIPLMVAAGAAGEDPATCVYGEQLMGELAVSSYRFGGGIERSPFDRGRGAGEAADHPLHPLEAT
jgi:aromatic ring-opening dioxygenase catalytic subunit (LigB family)